MLPSFSNLKSPSSFTSKLSTSKSVGVVREFTRRTMHGGTGWSAPASLNEHYQPQDHDQTVDQKPAGRLSEISLRRRKALPGEPEDARMTGGTRSLMRRLSGLNLGLGSVAVRGTSLGKTVAGAA